MNDDATHGRGVGGRLTVDLAALAANWRALAALAPSAETGAAVKADAYGHGLAAAGDALRSAGCRTFFVALPAEGATLRAAVPQATIYVLNGYFADAAETYRRERLRPVLGGPEEIDAWLAAASPADEPPALHVDTGMNRLGLSFDEAAALSAERPRVERLRPALVMSHLSCADSAEHPLNRLQIERFRAVRALFPGVAGSLSNSAGLQLGPATHHDLTRPGIALYGARAGNALSPLRPVATLEGRIVRVRTVRAGEWVGYGAAFEARRDSVIAIVSVGYADGYIRRSGASDAGSGASAAIDGQRVPLAGRVSMDLLAVDVTDLPAGSARPGAWVELFGSTIPVDEVADHAGTIGYELLTGLGSRLARRCIE
ncbi:alanine racemase [Chthonobacter albigriseus]|uniref:alanine racemase n=1 Tax=Chthonobacter albigriseus TaxID=1683161 RepID=UPI0015EE4B6F|nr:alanine racemase [Chthonobacter albigriseus]